MSIEHLLDLLRDIYIYISAFKLDILLKKNYT